MHSNHGRGTQYSEPSISTSTAAMPAPFRPLQLVYTLRSTQSRAIGLRRSQMTRPAPRRFQSNSTPTFTFRIGAASAAKRTPPRTPKYNQDYWAYASTNRNASPPYLRSTKADSGEDAFFATTIGDSENNVAFGVADGVGGWQDQGVDPSEFSHGLCGLMAGTAHLHAAEGGHGLRPQDLLQVAYDAVIGNPRILAGGSTACLAVIDQDGMMETANLGDSAFLILGPGKVVYKSEVQTHAFNTPFQMAKIPTKMATQYAIFGGEVKQFSENPSQAEVVRQRIKHGDVIVFATDGVWDNMSVQDALTTVTRVMLDSGYWKNDDNNETVLDTKRISGLPQEPSSHVGPEDYLPSLLATTIMREAKIAGLDRRRDGPFAKEVNARFPHEGWRGGKPDDIAVVVCLAVDGKHAPNTAGHQSASGADKPLKAKL
jgi:protein phosphatase PTC7